MDIPQKEWFVPCPNALEYRDGNLVGTVTTNDCGDLPMADVMLVVAGLEFIYDNYDFFDTVEDAQFWCEDIIEKVKGALGEKVPTLEGYSE